MVLFFFFLTRNKIILIANIFWMLNIVKCIKVYVLNNYKFVYFI